MNKNFEKELMTDDELNCKVHDPKSFVSKINHNSMTAETQNALINEKRNTDTVPQFMMEQYKKELNLPAYAEQIK